MNPQAPNGEGEKNYNVHQHNAHHNLSRREDSFRLAGENRAELHSEQRGEQGLKRGKSQQHHKAVRSKVLVEPAQMKQDCSIAQIKMSRIEAGLSDSSCGESPLHLGGRLARIRASLPNKARRLITQFNSPPNDGTKFELGSPGQRELSEHSKTRLGLLEQRSGPQLAASTN